MKDQNKDIFIRYTKYPNVQNIFNVSIPNIEDIKNDCLFVLDTNVLLKPYDVKTEDLTAIKSVYSKLISQKKLIIPGQVAREFVDNRPQKLKNIDQSLSRYQERIAEANKNKFLKFDYDKYPILSDMPDYQELTIIEENLNKKADEIQEKIKLEIEDYNKILNEYKNKFSVFKKKIEKWNYRDPISMMYADLFKENIIEFDFNEKTKDQIYIELEERYKYKIPPGYKDKGKEDDGIGDLIIWYTILQIAKRELKDIVFVGGDEKPDWFIRAEGKALYPRFELINEFKENAPNNHFSIINFAEFLEIFKVSPETVRRIEEIQPRKESNVDYITKRAEQATFNWLRNRRSTNTITSHKGFPDFVINTNNSQKIGVEVKMLLNSRSLQRVNEQAFRYLYEISKSGFNVFILVLVVPFDSEIEMAAIIDVAKEMLPIFETHTFTVVIAILHEDDRLEIFETFEN